MGDTRKLRCVVCWLAFGLYLAIIVFHTAHFPKVVEFDSARGIVAAMQFNVGRSPSPFHLVSADPSDLGKDINSPETWRAPSYQTLPYLLVWLGLSWGNALKVLILICIVAGLMGWGFTYWLMLRDACSVGALLLLTVCSSSMAANVVQYRGGNLLLWAAAPLILLTSAVSMRSGHSVSRCVLAVLSGSMSVMVFFLKYSGLFLGLGTAVAWMLASGRRWHDLRDRFVLFCIGAAGATVPLLLWYDVTGPNPVSSAWSQQRLFEAAMSLGTWPVAATDLASAIQWYATRFGVDGLGKSLFAPAAGLLILAGLLFVSWAQFSIRSLHGHAKQLMTPGREVYLVVLCAAAADTLLYAATIASGSAVEVSARLAKVTGALLLPLVFRTLCQTANSTVLKTRVVATSMIVTMFGLAPSFGSYALMSTIRDERSRLRSEIRATSLGWNVDISGLQRELDDVLPSRRTVLYLTYPDVLFYRPEQRFLLVYVLDRGYSIAELALSEYIGSPSDGIALLLPAVLVRDGRALAIQRSFKSVVGWRERPLRSAPGWSIWLHGPQDAS